MPDRIKNHKPPRISQPEARASAAGRGYGHRWREARAGFLQGKVCAECERQGRLTMPTVVDHVIPHRGDHGLFWDQGNWEALCKPCHDRKTGQGQ